LGFRVQPNHMEERRGSVEDLKAYCLIQVRYRNEREGLVDDVTLNELIKSDRIRQFYRPSEGRWVDIHTGPVRRGVNRYRGPERRTSVRKEPSDAVRPAGLFRRILGQGKKPISPSPSKPLDAKAWFEQGFVLLFSHGDYQGAVRAFALSIQMDPTYERAYLNRGMAYERLGNLQQAIEDYSRVIELASDDAKVYYIRGLAFRRLGMDAETIADLIRAADLGYRLAHDSLRSLGISLHAGQSRRDTRV